MEQHRFLFAAIVLLLSFGLNACQPSSSSHDEDSKSFQVAFVVFDAGETLGLLPVTDRLEAEGFNIRWLPLTPWASELLASNAQSLLDLPRGIDAMAHVGGREVETDVSYWMDHLVRDPPALVVSGMVSAAQAQIGRELQSVGIPTRGFHDGFQPPTTESIVAQTATSFDEVWVPTPRVQEGYAALGFDVAVSGQPSLEAWRRVSEEVEPDGVREALGVGPGDRVLLFAGQYGAGYAEVLSSFLSSMGEILRSDTSLVLVLSPHPRTDGAVESTALGVASGTAVVEAPGAAAPDVLSAAEQKDLAGEQLPRYMMAPEGLSTMEVATVSEMVLTWMSTVGVQAAFMGKQVIYFSPGPEFDGDLIERGIAFRADPTSLGRVIGQALSDPKEPDEIRRTLVDAGYVVEADSVVSELVKEAVQRSNPRGG